MSINTLVCIANKLDTNDIFNICIMSKYFYEHVYVNNEFWRKYIITLYPNFSSNQDKLEYWFNLVKQLFHIQQYPKNEQFIKSIRMNYVELIKLFLSDINFDPSANNNYAIIYASYHGHIEIIKLLLNHPRVDPSADNNYAIKIARQKGYTEIVKLLLNHSNY